MATESSVEARNVAGAITSMRIDELISDLAIGIARGQTELDQACMDIAKFMSEAQVAFGKLPNSDEPDLMSLIELGFTPNFYQFVDTILEVRVAISSKFEETREYESSDTQFQSEEREKQDQYDSQQSRRDTGVRSSGGSSSWGWGWWGGGSSWSSYSNSGVSTASSSQQSSSSKFKAKSLALTTVDAKYASTYNYAVEASSLIKTKIVPVPPPEVFEETVRDQLRQRRDWEKRMRLIDQIESILPGLGSTATALKEGLPVDGFATYKESAAQDQHDGLLKLEENYGALTTEHWTIIASVEDRRVLDDALRGGMNKIDQVLGSYGPDAKVPGIDVEPLFSGIAEDLTRFITRIDQVVNRLFPPEEE